MKKVKLTEMEFCTLDKDMQNEVKGGEAGNCGCSCYWANQGGSNTVDNGMANNAHGWYSPKGENVRVTGNTPSQDLAH